MTILTVGVGKEYSTVSAAIAASQDGDTIQVDAGIYTNDFAAINTDITLTAVGGMVHIIATIPPPDGKAIFTINGDVTINGFEFSGAKVADHNGAGIRFETGNLVINDCYFHDNEMGILTGNSGSGSLNIDDSEFANNTSDSTAGIGHNLYVGKIDSLIVTDSYFHDAQRGHEIKSRAENTTITDNRIQDEGGTAGYSIDIPNGGNALIQGNVIEQGPNSENSIIIAYGGEGNLYFSSSLIIQDNTIINDKTTSGVIGVHNFTSTVTAQITGNDIWGLSATQIASGANVQTGTIFLTTEPPLDESHPFEIPCFLRGTLIQTVDGGIPVEDLAIGDLVETASGAVRPIKWIGRRAYNPRFVSGNRNVLPIRIEADALADGVPARDLFVSPEHAMVIDALFLPARTLVNGATICQLESIERLEYFHLELDEHDVILAEGAQAETFIDAGGRRMFQNATEFSMRYPDAEPVDREAYETLLRRGMAGLPRVRAALLARAEHLGAVSRDPNLSLIVDGAGVRAQSVDSGVHRFVVAVGKCDVIIASRSVVPIETEADSLDARRLGVPLERITLSADGLRIEITPDCPALGDGFHADEGSHRWTNGRATLPPQALACFAGEIVIDIQVGTTDIHYPTAPWLDSRQWRLSEEAVPSLTAAL